MFKGRVARWRADIVLDENDRILLCRLAIPEPAGRVVWAAPGGGVERDETPLAALRRELHEEVGLAVDTDPPQVSPRIMENSSAFIATWKRKPNLHWHVCGAQDMVPVEVPSLGAVPGASIPVAATAAPLRESGHGGIRPNDELRPRDCTTL
ncbi:NUDIX hydrolase [Rhodococcus jostii]|uniref:NUDIX hydrolase n=1 Tax=Rhodococcus jostii TaxID=132919 RepID=A0ABU4CUD1_RHOJO|nr:NUDIX hydrolase [Rhodococcus jostii]MDV6286907.1 NUDIX hydrolase [Rhodococcus jostii]